MKLLCPVSAIFHAFPLLSSALPDSQNLFYEVCSFQASCFIYSSFMAMLKETLQLIELSLKYYGTFFQGASFSPEAGLPHLSYGTLEV